MLYSLDHQYWHSISTEKDIRYRTNGPTLAMEAAGFQGTNKRLAGNVDESTRANTNMLLKHFNALP